MSLSEISLNNVSLNYPILGVNSRSIKKHIIKVATGGVIKQVAGETTVVKALSDISFVLKKGDRLGLIGHNGAGKSTLLRVLAGIFEPSVGRVKIHGKISSLLDVNLGMQLELSGYENIKTRCVFLGIAKEDVPEIIADIEEFTEMGSYLSLPVKTYSSGMALRLAFGLSTVVTPDILLIDEVIGAGDARFLEKAKARMNTYVEQSNILVMASHSNEIVKQFCNKALWLEHGSLKKLGEVNQVISAYEEYCATA